MMRLYARKGTHLVRRALYRQKKHTDENQSFSEMSKECNAQVAKSPTMIRKEPRAYRSPTDKNFSPCTTKLYNIVGNKLERRRPTMSAPTKTPSPEPKKVQPRCSSAKQFSSARGKLTPRNTNTPGSRVLSGRKLKFCKSPLDQHTFSGGLSSLTKTRAKRNTPLRNATPKFEILSM